MAWLGDLPSAAPDRRPPPHGRWQDDGVSEEREVLTWEIFGAASRELAQMVVDSGFEPDILLSITRGGMLPAGAISYALDLKALHIINVEFYTGIDERLLEPVFLPPLPATQDFSGQKVLIVDDVADTGTTLARVRDFCAPHVAEVKVAVLYEKPRSLVKAEYVWRATDRWIAFPWSAQPPVLRRPGNQPANQPGNQPGPRLAGAPDRTEPAVTGRSHGEKGVPRDKTPQ